MMHGYGMYGFHWGWVFQLVLLALFFLVVWWLVRMQPSRNESPEDILKRRLAQGEITAKQYGELKKEIGR